MTVFQIMTMENWQEILYLCLKSTDAEGQQSWYHKSFSLLYLLSWIFFGNFLLLNLFLAILIDGFTSKEKKNEDDIFEGEEDLEIMHLRLKKKTEM